MCSLYLWSMHSAPSDEKSPPLQWQTPLGSQQMETLMITVQRAAMEKYSCVWNGSLLSSASA